MGMCPPCADPTGDDGVPVTPPRLCELLGPPLRCAESYRYFGLRCAIEDEEPTTVGDTLPNSRCWCRSSLPLGGKEDDGTLAVEVRREWIERTHVDWEYELLQVIIRAPHYLWRGGDIMGPPQPMCYLFLGSHRRGSSACRPDDREIVLPQARILEAISFDAWVEP
jgi:hypothetical protein